MHSPYGEVPESVNSITINQRRALYAFYAHPTYITHTAIGQRRRHRVHALQKKLCGQREKPNCIKEGTHAHSLEQSLLRIVSTRAHREAKVLAHSRRAIAKLAEHYSFPLRDAHEKAVIVPATPEGSFPRTDDGKYRARRAAQRAAGTPH